MGAVVAADGKLHLRHCPAEPFPSGEHGCGGSDGGNNTEMSEI